MIGLTGDMNLDLLIEKRKKYFTTKDACSKHIYINFVQTFIHV